MNLARRIFSEVIEYRPLLYAVSRANGITIDGCCGLSSRAGAGPQLPRA